MQRLGAFFMRKIEREGDVVSVDEINRIMNHLDRQDEKIGKIQNDIARVLVTVEDVPTVVQKLNGQDTSIELIKKDQKNCQEHCQQVQAAKKEQRAPWRSLAFSTALIVIGIIAKSLFDLFAK